MAFDNLGFTRKHLLPMAICEIFPIFEVKPITPDDFLSFFFQMFFFGGVN